MADPVLEDLWESAYLRGDLSALGAIDHPAAMRMEHEAAETLGLLDDGQPTRWAHYQHRIRVTAEFTPLERVRIRTALELLAEGSQDEGSHH